MKAYDFSGEHPVKDLSDIERVMSRRFEGNVNEVLLASGKNAFPLLAILIRENMASINYVPGDKEAGFTSIGGNLGLPPDGMTIFAMGDPSEEIAVSNRSIVTFTKALEAAKEFFRTKQLPKSIRWLEL
jgi:Immunity protein Imm1